MEKENPLKQQILFRLNNSSQMAHQPEQHTSMLLHHCPVLYKCRLLTMDLLGTFLRLYLR